MEGKREREAGSPADEGGHLGRKEEGEAEEMCLPASPASVSAFPCHQQKTVCTIAAHEGTLAAITFNASGSKLASASEKVSVSLRLHRAVPSGLCCTTPSGPKVGHAGTGWSLGLLGIHFQGVPLPHACCVYGYTVVQQAEGLGYARYGTLDTDTGGVTEERSCRSPLTRTEAAFNKRCQQNVV